jgi:putative transposase
MRFACIHHLRADYPLVLLCHMRQVSLSGYYCWRNRRPCAREQANAELLGKIRTVHNEHRGIYRTPHIHAELQAQGDRCSRKRIERLMRHNGMQGK